MTCIEPGCARKRRTDYARCWWCNARLVERVLGGRR